MLVTVIKQLFPNEEILEEYKSFGLIFPVVAGVDSTPQQIEIDVYLPCLKLAFEFQGIHHYEDHFSVGDSSDRQNRDQEKRAACVRAGIRLVEVPQTWDGSLASVQRLIQQEAPGIGHRT